MLAGLSPVCRKGTLKLRKLVPNVYGITNFSKKLLNEVCAKSEPAKLLTEVRTHGSTMYR